METLKIIIIILISYVVFVGAFGLIYLSIILQRKRKENKMTWETKVEKLIQESKKRREK